MAARGEGGAGPSGQDNGEVMRIVRISIAHAGAEENHAVVEQGSLALTVALKLSQQVGVLFHVPEIDPLVLRPFVGVVLVVRDLMMSAAHAFQEGEVATAYRVAKHKGRDAGRIRPEG